MLVVRLSSFVAILVNAGWGRMGALCILHFDLCCMISCGLSIRVVRFVLQALCRVAVVFLYIIVGDLSWCCLL